MFFISPLVPLTASLILGIICQATVNTPWLVLICISILTVTFFAHKNNQKLLLFITLSVCFFMAGALRYAHQKHHFQTCMDAISNKSCTLIARIEDIEPSFRKAGTTVMTVTMHELKHYETIIPQAHHLNLKISTQQSTSHLRPGDTISCSKIFIRNSTNEDYTRYLIKENIVGQVITSQPIKQISRPHYSLYRWLIEKRNELIRRAEQHLTPTTFTLFTSIFWGKKELDQRSINSVKDQFKIWGILHYLARSGLHVILFIIMWNWLFALLPFPFSLKQFLLVCIIIGYHLISWPSISFIRSIILFVLYKICLIHDLSINILHLLALTCTIVLLNNPFQLFFLDFQLSFGLTFALGLFSLLQKS